MRPTKLTALTFAAVVAAAPLAACSSSGSSGGSSAHPTLTYWASNQGTSLQDDRQVLSPQIAKFTQETGIKVNFQVIPWTTLLTQITAATVSGKGPDVLNIGNTWSASLQATGAFVPFTSSVMNQIGGSSRFLAGSLSATGAAWQATDGRPVVQHGLRPVLQQGSVRRGRHQRAAHHVGAAGRRRQEAHHGRALGPDARGRPDPGERAPGVRAERAARGIVLQLAGQPTFDTPQNVAAIMQMIDFMQADKIASPGDAQYSKGTEALTDYATGKAAMVFWQTASGSLAKLGMNAADVGVAPLPLPSPMPAGGKTVTSMVAGINLAIFKNTKNLSAAEQFVKFMTSTPEQETLNQTYGSLPTVSAAYSDPAFHTPAVTTFRSILSSTAAPMPAVPQEANFETTVGTAIIHLYADAATGKTVTSTMIAQALSQAQQQLGG